jgi:hypothetical protein
MENEANLEGDDPKQSTEKEKRRSFKQIEDIATLYKLTSDKTLAEASKDVKWNLPKELEWIQKDQKSILDSIHAKSEGGFKYQLHLTYINGIIKNTLKNQTSCLNLLTDYEGKFTGTKELDRISDFVAFLIETQPTLKKSSEIDGKWLTDWKIQGIPIIDTQIISLDDIDANPLTKMKSHDTFSCLFFAKINLKKLTDEKDIKKIKEAYNNETKPFQSAFITNQDQAVEAIGDAQKKSLIRSIFRNASQFSD